jgi:hypothetical protein
MAVIARLKNVRAHPNADRIKLANCLGYQVIVGLEAKDDDIVILFPDDGQLSHEYIFNNNLYNKAEMNKDPSVKTGFFDHKRRVRCQTFRGEKSEAYTADIRSVEFTGVDIESLYVGVRFDVLNDISICNKYITQATKDAANKNGNKDKVKLNVILKKMFPEHIDTEQIRFARDEDLIGLVTITHKLHGTSARTGYINTPVEVPLKWYHKLWNQYVKLVDYLPPKYTHEQNEALYFAPTTIKKWKTIFGTRRVIKGPVNEEATDYRSLCAKRLAPFIEKGEIWYYEIVGYEDTGALIMGSVSTKEMPKEFQKRFGETITYKYGCLPGTWNIYVYRITHQNEDGVIYELPWAQVKAKCNNAAIKHVPEIDVILTEVALDGTIDVEVLKQTIEHYTEDEDIAEPLDASHIREGICVRIDNLETGKMKIFKNKTFVFKVLEGIVKDSGVVDTEEAEG